jgi:hypothetical protein
VVRGPEVLVILLASVRIVEFGTHSSSGHLPVLPRSMSRPPNLRGASFNVG